MQVTHIWLKDQSSSNIEDLLMSQNMLRNPGLWGLNSERGAQRLADTSSSISSQLHGSDRGQRIPLCHGANITEQLDTCERADAGAHTRGLLDLECQGAKGTPLLSVRPWQESPDTAPGGWESPRKGQHKDGTG